MSEFDEETLKTMKLHDLINFNTFSILRVYKGWIYTFTKRVHCNGRGEQYVMTSVFVPRD